MIKAICPYSRRASCRTTGWVSETRSTRFLRPHKPATRLRCYAATPRPELAARAPGVDSCHPSPPLRAPPGQGVNKPRRTRVLRGFPFHSSRASGAFSPFTELTECVFSHRRSVFTFHPFAGRELSVFPGERGISELCTKGNEIRPRGGRTKSTPCGVDDICAWRRRRYPRCART